ncbi:MAG: protein kinase [Planctomycetes bacterium]|nr:protein kinase [Planctomycetota bacterium]MBL7039888.1 protein kinase [Pirellulaceae bacterium]
MQCQLVIVAGPEKGRTFPIEDGQTLAIGRGQASDTQINDPRMSRVHCRVQMDGGKVILLDAGSSSGTFVAGEKTVQHELKPGEMFQVGDTRIRYQFESTHEPTTLGGEQLLGRPKPQPKVPPLKDLVGQSLHNYRLDEIITAGTSGMVFKAYDTENDRVAAVKVLTPDFTNSEEQKERFVRGMKTMLPIRHSNIVQLYHAGKKGPYCYAAMEYVDGESLTQVIDRMGFAGMLDWREVWRVAVHIGRALAEAYDQKIIHRNVTPTNILRRHKDKACLLGDLMLAKALEGTLAKQVTQPGQIVGDVPYMSPERTRGSEGVDCRSDIYGLGATVYALLTGKPPFESKSLPELIRLVREAAPVKPREHQLSINEMFQDHVVMRALEKDPRDRHQTPAELLRDLDRVGKFNSLDADWSEWVG